MKKRHLQICLGILLGCSSQVASAGNATLNTIISDQTNFSTTTQAVNIAGTGPLALNGIFRVINDVNFQTASHSSAVRITTAFPVTFGGNGDIEIRTYNDATYAHTNALSVDAVNGNVLIDKPTNNVTLALDAPGGLGTKIDEVAALRIAGAGSTTTVNAQNLILENHGYNRGYGVWMIGDAASNLTINGTVNMSSDANTKEAYGVRLDRGTLIINGNTTMAMNGTGNTGIRGIDGTATFNGNTTITLIGDPSTTGTRTVSSFGIWNGVLPYGMKPAPGAKMIFNGTTRITTSGLGSTGVLTELAAGITEFHGDTFITTSGDKGKRGMGLGSDQLAHGVQNSNGETRFYGNTTILTGGNDASGIYVTDGKVLLNDYDNASASLTTIGTTKDRANGIYNSSGTITGNSDVQIATAGVNSYGIYGASGAGKTILDGNVGIVSNKSHGIFVNYATNATTLNTVHINGFADVETKTIGANAIQGALGLVELNGGGHLKTVADSSTYAINTGGVSATRFGKVTGIGQFQIEGNLRSNTFGQVDLDMQAGSWVTGVASRTGTYSTPDESILNFKMTDSRWDMTDSSNLSYLNMQNSVIRYTNTGPTDLIISPTTATVAQGIYTSNNDSVFVNRGLIDMQSNNVLGDRLIVGGNYNGGGAIAMNTAVYDRGSATDFIFINGDQKGGVTDVYVKDMSPSQATNTGIGADSGGVGYGVLIAQGVGDWDVNQLRLASGKIIKLGYEYDLYGVEEYNTADIYGNTQVELYNWYLQSKLSPHPPIYPINTEMGLRSNYAMMQNLHQRLGETRHWDIKNEKGEFLWQEGWRPWAQYIYSTGDTHFSSCYDYHFNISGFQAGFERMLRSDDLKKRRLYGAFIGQLDGDSGLHANNDVRGGQRNTYGGLYWTWQQTEENRHSTYWDMVFTAGKMDYTANYESLHDKYDGKNFSASIEWGRAFRMNEKKDFIIEPQAQLFYGWSDSEDFTSADGSTIDDSKSDTLIGRLGIRVQKTYENDKKDRRISPYFRFNAIKPFSGSNTAYVNGEKWNIENREVIWQAGIGLTMDLNKKWDFYGEVDRNWGGTQGWELRGGLKVKF